MQIEHLGFWSVSLEATTRDLISIASCTKAGTLGMGFNQRRMARERAAALRAEEERRERELDRDVIQAKKLVAIWNSRTARKARPSFYPTTETAIIAGSPWLSFMSPACQHIGEVDLRTLDRHPLMPISGLIPSLSCRWCCPNPPFAKPLGLSTQSTIATAIGGAAKWLISRTLSFD